MPTLKCTSLRRQTHLQVRLLNDPLRGFAQALTRMYVCL